MVPQFWAKPMRSIDIPGLFCPAHALNCLRFQTKKNEPGIKHQKPWNCILHPNYTRGICQDMRLFQYIL